MTLACIIKLKTIVIDDPSISIPSLSNSHANLLYQDNVTFKGEGISKVGLAEFSTLG
jgi:hypothetical protein